MSTYTYDRQNKMVRRDGTVVAVVTSAKGASRAVEELVRAAGGEILQAGEPVKAK